MSIQLIFGPLICWCAHLDDSLRLVFLTVSLVLYAHIVEE